MSKRKKKAATPPIRGLTIAGGILDEAYSDPDIESSVAAAVAADPINDLTSEPKVEIIGDSILEYVTPGGGIMQFMPSTWEKPEEKEYDPAEDIRAAIEYTKKNYGVSVTVTNPDPMQNSKLMELLFNQARSGRSTMLPNDGTRFEYSETPVTPEPDDGLRRPEMK